MYFTLFLKIKHREFCTRKKKFFIKFEFLFIEFILTEIVYVNNYLNMKNVVYSIFSDFKYKIIKILKFSIKILMKNIII